MGIDVELYGRRHHILSDAERIALRDAFTAEFGGPEPWLDSLKDVPSYWIDHQRTMRVRSSQRYYGPGYERGDWPHIRAMGDWLAERFDEVSYGGDSWVDDFEDGMAWEEARSVCDRHWERWGHFPYHKHCGCDQCEAVGHDKSH